MLIFGFATPNPTEGARASTHRPSRSHVELFPQMRRASSRISKGITTASSQDPDPPRRPLPTQPNPTHTNASGSRGGHALRPRPRRIASGRLRAATPPKTTKESAPRQLRTCPSSIQTSKAGPGTSRKDPLRQSRDPEHPKSDLFQLRWDDQSLDQGRGRRPTGPSTHSRSWEAQRLSSSSGEPSPARLSQHPAPYRQ